MFYRSPILDLKALEETGSDTIVGISHDHIVIDLAGYLL